MTDYREYVIETYDNPGEPSSKRIRARPLAGQGVSVAMNVECSEAMRLGHPPGTKFVVRCKLKDKQGGAPFLYTSWQWSYRVVDAAEARALIQLAKTGRA